MDLPAPLLLEFRDERVPFLEAGRDREPLVEPDPLDVPELLVPDEPVVPPWVVELDLLPETPEFFDPAETLTETAGVPDTRTFTAPETGPTVALTATVGTRTATVGRRTGTVGTRTGTVGTTTVGTGRVGTTTVGSVGSGSASFEETGSPAPLATPPTGAKDAIATATLMAPTTAQIPADRIERKLMRRMVPLLQPHP